MTQQLFLMHGIRRCGTMKIAPSLPVEKLKSVKIEDMAIIYQHNTLPILNNGL